MAGLRPGIYTDGSTAFLNPRSVRLTELREPAAPPTVFTRLATRRAELLHRNEQPEESHALKNELRELYAALRRLTWIDASPGPWSLLGIRGRQGGFPFDDHCSLFRGRSGLVWTSQPYFIDAPVIRGFAHLHGLSVTVSKPWSWHCPGMTYLIEWRKKRTPAPRPFPEPSTR